MNKFFLLILTVLIFSSSACRFLPVSNDPTVGPVESPPPATPTAVSTKLATAVSTSTPLPPEPKPESLPAPTLFDTSWDDREIYKSGLTASEHAALAETMGAPVYHIDLAVETPMLVNGRQEVLYTNQEEQPLDRIYFHQFANQLGGSIHISHVQVNGQPVETTQEASALCVPLAEPLPPGGQVVVQMDFQTNIPRGEDSTKYNVLAFEENILALAHFYPMVATFDSAGWHIEPSPPNGDETYSDAAFYRVRLTAPDSQVIAASGVEVEQQNMNGSQILSLAAGPARDFYIAMSEDFTIVSEQVGDIQINSYAPANKQAGAALAGQAAADALQIFTEQFGPYPYTEFDIVSTPTLALGIEYPGIVANALRIYDLEEQTGSGTPNSVFVESTTVHEVAHQWFYNLIGNDQINEPWLDESLTQYATWSYYAHKYGEPGQEGFGDSLEGRWARVEFAEVPIGLPADAYSGAEYGAIVYGRGPIFIDTLAQTMGQETFDAFMQDYNQVYRWEIATSGDFKTLAEMYCDCDLTQLFAEWVFLD